jgi:hypothetical protein
MPWYKVYTIDKDGISNEAADDADAVVKARQTIADGNVEIWEGMRLVAQVEAPQENAC